MVVKTLWPVSGRVADVRNRLRLRNGRNGWSRGGEGPVATFNKERWPPDGAVRVLLEYLDELHRGAGQPSMRDMGDAIGLSSSGIQPYFAGTRLISKGNLQLLVNHLGGDVSRAERLRKMAATEWNDSRRRRETPIDINAKSSVTSFTRAEQVSRGRAWSVPRQLPASPRWFVGREAEMRRLNDILDRQQRGATVGISAIGGMGGIGKTALALHWAHQNIHRFPDGQLFINLRGFDPVRPPLSPMLAVRTLLDALGVKPRAVPGDVEACAALYRSILAERKIIIIADNAHDFAQVAPLIPGNSKCVMLVTSRYQIAGLRMRGANLMRLDVLSDSEARQLLTVEIGAERKIAEKAPLDSLATACGGLPLALEIVAGRAIVHPDFPLQVLAEELRETSARLDRLVLGDPGGNVRAVFSWSYTRLPPEVARAFRLVGIAPGATIEVTAVAALANVSIDQAKSMLGHLESSSLIYQYRLYRYRMHDLVRLYAAEQAERDESASAREAALRRVLDHYLYTAHAGDRLIAEHRRPIDLGMPVVGSVLMPLRDDISAMQWFSVEHSNILAAQGLAASHGWHDRVWQFAWVLDSYHWRRGHLYEDISSWEAGLAAAERVNDSFAIGLAHRRLGRAYGRANRCELALHHMTVGLGFAKQAQDAPGQAHARRILAWICHQLGDDDSALQHATASVSIYEELRNPVWTAHALDELGVCHTRLGQYDAANDCCSRALELHRQHHHRAGEAESLDSLGTLMLVTRQYESAAERYREALVIYRSLDNTYDEANVLDHLGRALIALGRQDEARQAWAEALSLYEITHRTAEAAHVIQLLEDNE